MQLSIVGMPKNSSGIRKQFTFHADHVTGGNEYTSDSFAILRESGISIDSKTGKVREPSLTSITSIREDEESHIPINVANQIELLGTSTRSITINGDSATKGTQFQSKHKLSQDLS